MINIRKKLILVTYLGLISMQSHAKINSEFTESSLNTKIEITESLTKAVVKKVDSQNGKIILKHEEIKNLDMPGMTMAFKVKDITYLESLKEGDIVEAQLDKENGIYVINKIVKK